MAERYEDQYRRDRGNRPNPNDRGFIDRAGDEVRSWFGDDDAERRRQLDDRDQGREGGYRGPDQGRNGGGSDRAPGGPDRGYGGANPGSYDRGTYSRPVNRDSLGDRGQAFTEAGSADRNYGGYTDRAFSSTYDYRGGSGQDHPDRDRAYPPYGWRGQNEPSSQTSGHRDQPSSRDERGGRNFVGHGPRGYQRSDSRINEDVCDCLSDSADVDARNIDVLVSSGEVTLNGSVSDRSQKRRAEDLIEHLSGVREVRNNLRVTREGESTKSSTSASTAASPSDSSNGLGEQPGNVLGVGGGAPDRASTAGGR